MTISVPYSTQRSKVKPWEESRGQTKHDRHSVPYLAQRSKVKNYPEPALYILLNADQIEAQEFIRVIKDLNERMIFRRDGDTEATTKSVRLSVIATRITRVVVRVGTIDIDDEGYHKKMPDVLCDTIASRKRKADDDLDESIVTIQASDTSPVIEVSENDPKN